MRPERILNVIENAYALGSDEPSWLESISKASFPLLDCGYGVLAYTSVIDDFGLYAQTYASHRASAVATLSSRFIVHLFSKNLREATLSGNTYGKVSDILNINRLLLGLKSRGLMWGPVDAVGIGGWDRADRVVTVSAPSGATESMSARDRELCRFLGEQLGAALRLRRLAATPRLDDGAVEAVLEEDGRVAHASGLARDAEWQVLLKGALSVADRSRASLIASTWEPWDAVVGGRWSLVRRVDSDGRRYIVAYRNPPGMIDPRRLSLRQAEVVTLAALGHSDKEIAHELQVSGSTVRTTLREGLRRLGLKTRVELPGLWRDLRGRAYPLHSDSTQDFLVIGSEASVDELPSDWRLTQAESEVMWGILQGKSNREIANVRNVSERTVANQVRSLFERAGCRSRSELAGAYEEWATTGQATGGRAVRQEG